MSRMDHWDAAKDPKLAIEMALDYLERQAEAAEKQARAAERQADTLDRIYMRTPR